MDKANKAMLRRHRGHLAKATVTRRLEELRAAIARARERTTQPDAEADRAESLHAIEAIEAIFAVVDMPDSYRRREPSSTGLAYLLMAVERASAATTCRHIGIHPFGLLFDAGAALGMAILAMHNDNERRAKASPTHSASRRLRELTRSNPDLSAGALRRILEAESGGRMDDSAARAVVRSVRKR